MENDYVIASYLDFSRAFDTLDYQVYTDISIFSIHIMHNTSIWCFAFNFAAMRVLSSKMSEFKTEITSKMRDFNTEIATQMLDFKVEIPASEEDSGEKIGSQGEHDDVEERLIKQNRKIEEILTLQIKLVNVEKDRAKLAKDLSQQQWTHENLQAKHNALLSHHQCLSKDPALMQDTSDDEKKRQAEEMEEISDLKKELQLSRQEVEEHQKAHGALMAKYKAKY